VVGGHLISRGKRGSRKKGGKKGELLTKGGPERGLEMNHSPVRKKKKETGQTIPKKTESNKKSHLRGEETTVKSDHCLIKLGKGQNLPEHGISGLRVEHGPWEEDGDMQSNRTSDQKRE